jgi:hypothetical protein
VLVEWCVWIDDRLHPTGRKSADIVQRETGVMQLIAMLLEKNSNFAFRNKINDHEYIYRTEATQREMHREASMANLWHDDTTFSQ